MTAVYTNIIDIISRRMHRVSYWADVVAAFPTDWVLGMLGSHEPQTLAYCKINRLVKIYKVSLRDWKTYRSLSAPNDRYKISTLE